MSIFVTIITVAFFAHCSLISVQWCCCMVGNAEILSAEERVSHIP